MSPLKTIQIETQQNPDSAIIWLHGLGADGHDFAPIIPQLNLSEKLAIRFLFPHAPVIPISINQGYPMPGWYDIYSNDIVSAEDEKGIRASSAAISQLCEQQRTAGIPSARIILAGFSQGGAIALHCGLSYPHTLAGIMALSTYLPLHSSFSKDAHLANQQTDIFMAHGSQDDVVAYTFGRKSFQLLHAAGYPAHWHEYAMGHSVCQQEIGDIATWINSRLS